MEKQILPGFSSFNRSMDHELITTEGLCWEGPFSWLGYNKHNDLDDIHDVAGVYLFTFEYRDGYILRSVGVSKSIKKRISQHTREYKKGNYTILDVNSAKVGIRKEVWHGWGYAKKNIDQFNLHKDYMLSAIDDELAAYRLFTANVSDKRKRERIEFSIMHNVYGAKEPWSDLVDGGMHLIGRSNYDIPIIINNKCLHRIYGLADYLEI